MKKLITLFSFLLVASLSYGQYAEKPEVNIGVGLLPNFIAGVGGIPVSVSVDYPLSSVDNLTVGGYVGYMGANKDFSNTVFNYKIKYSAIVFGARATYHFDILKVDKLDTYVGAMLGYNYVGVKYVGDNLPTGLASNVSGIGWAGLLGVKYGLTNSIKAFAELGYGISLATVGISFAL